MSQIEQLEFAKENLDTVCRDDKDNKANIYRYKFTDEFTAELYKFSKVHQYDHRKDFKEAWSTWVEDYSELVDGEVQRLTELGYEGDIIDKMFKSARYYFRKKSTEKKEPKSRKQYVGLQKDLLEAIDDHIKDNIYNSNFKPADAFLDFCKTNKDLLQEGVTVLCKSGLTDSNEIKEKFKKTYKNRYFMFVSK